MIAENQIVKDEFEIHESHQLEEDLIPVLASTTEITNGRDFEHAKKCILAMPFIKKWGIADI